MHSSNREAREAYLREILFKNPKMPSRQASQLVKDKFGQSLQRSYVLEIKREYQMPKAPHATIVKAPKAPKPEPLTKTEKSEVKIATREKILNSEGFRKDEASYLAKKDWGSNYLQQYRQERHALFVRSKERGDSRATFDMQIGEVYKLEGYATEKGRLKIKLRYLDYLTEHRYVKHEKKEKLPPAPMAASQLRLEQTLQNNGFLNEDAHFIANAPGMDKSLASPSFVDALNKVVNDRKKLIKDLKAKGINVRAYLAVMKERQRDKNITPFDYIREKYEVTKTALNLSMEKLRANFQLNRHIAEGRRVDAAGKLSDFNTQMIKLRRV
jgi:hypothetical protein